MSKSTRITLIFLLLFISLISCSSGKGLFQSMPGEIHTISTFIKVWISIFVLNIIIYHYLRHIGTIILFVIILIFKDYGFLMTTLIFGLDTLVIYLYLLIRLYLNTKK
jgi:hypothetical protein